MKKHRPTNKPSLVCILIAIYVSIGIEHKERRFQMHLKDLSSIIFAIASDGLPGIGYSFAPEKIATTF